MFAAYDNYLAMRCAEVRSFDNKKTSVRAAFKILAAELYNLDKIDFHNACLLEGIKFPSIIYD